MANDYESNLRAQMLAKSQYDSRTTGGVGMGAALCPASDTVQSRLKYALENHKQKAVEIERLLGLLERNPDIEEILNLTRSLL